MSEVKEKFLETITDMEREKRNEKTVNLPVMDTIDPHIQNELIRLGYYYEILIDNQILRVVILRKI